MKYEVRLTKSVELSVEGETEETVLDWLLQMTPDNVIMLLGEQVYTEYNEEIVRPIDDNSEVNYVIEED